MTACPELVELNCESNRLQTLDLSGNPALVRLYCRHNQLQALDVRNNLELAFIETFDNQLTDFDGSMPKKLKFLHIDYNRLTTLDMSGNPALEGNGFVAANNQLDTLVLPDIPGFQVEAEVFYEQNPRTGYDRVEWYLDPDFTRPVAGDGVLEATGQTLYVRRYQTVEQTMALTVTEPAPADPPESPADDPSDGSAEGSAPAGGSGRPSPAAPEGTLPQTGDAGPAPWAAGLLTAGLGLAVLAAARRKAR